MLKNETEPSKNKRVRRREDHGTITWRILVEIGGPQNKSNAVSLPPIKVAIDLTADILIITQMC
jgi:hypothetical protein